MSGTNIASLHHCRLIFEKFRNKTPSNPRVHFRNVQKLNCFNNNLQVVSIKLEFKYYQVKTNKVKTIQLEVD